MILGLRTTARSVREVLFLLHRAVIALERIAGALETTGKVVAELAAEELSEKPCPASGQIPCSWHPEGGNHPGVVD